MNGCPIRSSKTAASSCSTSVDGSGHVERAKPPGQSTPPATVELPWRCAKKSGPERRWEAGRGHLWACIGINTGPAQVGYGSRRKFMYGRWATPATSPVGWRAATKLPRCADLVQARPAPKAATHRHATAYARCVSSAFANRLSSTKLQGEQRRSEWLVSNAYESACDGTDRVKWLQDVPNLCPCCNRARPTADMTRHSKIMKKSVGLPGSTAGIVRPVLELTCK